MKTITVDILNPRSINKAVRDLERYADKLEAAEGKIAESVAEVGSQIAGQYFFEAQYAGLNDVSVHVETEESSARVVAEGEAAAFIEFGTGVVMGQGATLPRPPGIVGLGQYGLGHGAHPPWVYHGVMGVNPPPGTVRLGANSDKILTHGNPPAGALMRASNEMEDQAAEIVRKELSKL